MDIFIKVFTTILQTILIVGCIVFKSTTSKDKELRAANIFMALLAFNIFGIWYWV